MEDIFDDDIFLDDEVVVADVDGLTAFLKLRRRD
jgi:hypothetical protein